MINQRPVFINGLSRGGTTAVLQLLLSHPDLCAPGRETHHAFRGPGLSSNSVWTHVRKFLFNYLPVSLALPSKAFSPRNIGERGAPPQAAIDHIDRVLHIEKMKFHGDIREGERYGKDARASSRLASKNIDGITRFTEMLDMMYPDAIHFGLIRNGLAVCDGRVRRGFQASNVGAEYADLVSRMVEHAEQMPNYHIIRFEDFLHAPAVFADRLLELADTDTSCVEKFRVERAPIVQRDDQRGLHMVGTPTRTVRWFTREELAGVIDPQVDDNQIERISDHDRAAFLFEACETMQRVGYI